MKKKSTPSSLNSGSESQDLFHQVFNACARKGWLNRAIRIRYLDRSYRIYCTENAFMTYRINDNYGISPGLPGWLECILAPGRVMKDISTPSLPSGDLTADDWLMCLRNGKFEII